MTTEDFLRRQIIPLAYRQLPAGELLLRAAAGDPEAFIALVCVKYSLVERACRQALGPAGPAEDVAAETFLQLWRQRDKVRDPQAIDGWLTTTARNLAMKLVAAQTRGRTANEEWSRRTAAFITPQTPDRAAIHEEIIQRVRRALEEQSDSDQRLLWTAEHSGCDAHAADVLGLSVSTYRVRLHRARQRLRTLLKKYGVAPLVGAIAMFGYGKNRAASTLAKWWATTVGKVLILGMSLCGAAAITCWIQVSNSQQSIRQIPRPGPNPTLNSPIVIETLQDRNRRIVKDQFVDRLRELIQPFYVDNRIELVAVRAFGSEVEVEFRTERPPTVESGLAERLRGRYCTFRRRYVVYAQPPGSDRWHLMKPAKPVAIEVPLPPLGVVIEVVAGKTEYAEAKRLFDRLPKDSTAETEMLHYLFGTSGDKLRLPAAGNGFTVHAGQIILVDGDRSMYVRDQTGKWRFEGECPGWWLVAHDGQLYCTTGDDILTRPIDSPGKPWVLWRKIPEFKSGERGGFLAISRDRFYFAVHPNVLCHCPPADSKAAWVRDENEPIWPDGITATADRLFAHDATHILSRPAQDLSAPWTKVAPIPDGKTWLAVDGDRLLAYGGPGPIYARPLAADSMVDWEVVGEAHLPPR